jgi:hypothetical protein
MCRKFGAAFSSARQGEQSPYRYVNRFNQLAMFCQRQWSDTLYGVVRLLHQ